MGATTFQTYARGADAQAAYLSACDEALRYYGSDSYNGTISTTSGFHLATKQPMTRSGAELYAYMNDSQGEKWGDAVGIPVADNADFTFAEVSLQVDLPTEMDVLDWDGKPTGKKRPTTSQDLEDAARKQASKFYGATVHDVSVAMDSRHTYEVVSPEGRATTVYQVENRVYPTKAAAVAAAKALMDKGDYTTLVKIKALKQWPAPGGEYAAVVMRKTTKARAVATVMVATPIGTPTVTGWLFFGWAAC